MSFLSKFRRKPRRQISPVFDLGFHGDKYLLDLVDDFMQVVEAFVETGANVGTTARYVAKTYPTITVFTCEPDPDAFKVARETLSDHKNAHLYKMKSPQFLHAVHKEHPSLLTSTNLYYLDAHDYGFKWPLKEEIKFISSQLENAIIIIDDAKAPDNPQFKYCAYDGQECNIDYLKDALVPGKQYHLCYPTYTEKTSSHHPLTGYLVVGFGDKVVERLMNVEDDFKVCKLG